MQYIVSAIAFIIAWIAKNIARYLAFLPVYTGVITLAIIVIGLYLSAYVSFLIFVSKLMHLIKSYLLTMNDFSSVSDGSVGTFTIHQLLSISWQFLVSSGVGPAIYNALYLFFTFAFLYLGFKLPKVVGSVYKEVYDIFATSAGLLK